MGRMGQPEEGFGVELANPFTGKPQGAANGRKGLGWAPIQAVVGDDDGLQAGGREVTAW